MDKCTFKVGDAVKLKKSAFVWEFSNSNFQCYVSPKTKRVTKGYDKNMKVCIYSLLYPDCIDGIIIREGSLGCWLILFNFGFAAFFDSKEFTLVRPK